MEALKEFGLDPMLLVAQIVNFVVIFIIFKKYLYKPILEMLKKREDTIKDGLKKAEEAQALYEKTAEKEKEILQKAQKLASSIINDAKEESLGILKENEDKLKQQTEKMLKEAQAQIQEETKKAEIILSKNVSELAIAFLKKSLTGMFSEKNQQEIMSKALKQIKQN